PGLSVVVLIPSQLTWHNSRPKEKEKTKMKTTSKVMITPSGGTAFTIKGNSDAIAAYIILQGNQTSSNRKVEFAGFAADALPIAGLIEEIEALKLSTFIVVEKEP
ncbi:hypothetical protein C0989_010461, partial [Termitomyces sp. Mn162]